MLCSGQEAAAFGWGNRPSGRAAPRRYRHPHSKGVHAV